MNLPTNMTTMSSLEIAQLTGRNHRDVMRSIRNMEPAWEKVNGRKFALVEYPDTKGENRPMYHLNKTECLYVATKFNDEARAKLVVRWEQLETTGVQQISQLTQSITQIANSVAQMAKSQEAILNSLASHTDRLNRLENRQAGIKPEKTSKLPSDAIDARNIEFDFAKVNDRNVRRIIVNDMVYYNISDIQRAIVARTASSQVAKRLNRIAPFTIAKIHILGNTHPAWFCTKRGLDLIQAGSRKVGGKSMNCELN